LSWETNFSKPAAAQQPLADQRKQSASGLLDALQEEEHFHYKLTVVDEFIYRSAFTG